MISGTSNAQNLLNEIRKRKAESGAELPPKSEDELLREKHPALQEAWERYQLIYKMVKPAAEPAKEESASNILNQIRQRANKANTKRVKTKT